MPKVKLGDRVQIHYVGSFKDGETFDHSGEGDPLEFTAGSSELIPAVSQAVIGMEAGEKKVVDVKSEDGYGPIIPDLIHRVETAKLPQGVEIGTQLQTEVEGQTIIFMVTAIAGDQATLDANHPLAGKDLVFDLELINILKGYK